MKGKRNTQNFIKIGIVFMALEFRVQDERTLKKTTTKKVLKILVQTHRFVPSAHKHLALFSSFKY